MLEVTSINGDVKELRRRLPSDLLVVLGDHNIYSLLDQDHIEIEHAAKAMHTRLKFRKYKDRMDGIESKVAVTLDPRFKIRMFHHDQDDLDEVLEKANEFLKRVRNVPAPAPAKKSKLLSQLALDRLRESTSSTTVSNEELDEYLAEAVTPPHTKPLDWWKRNKNRFPKLAILARKLFAVNPTSTASEHVNSLGRQLMPYTAQDCRPTPSGHPYS